MADERKIRVALRRKSPVGMRYLYFFMIVSSVFSSALAILLNPSPGRIIFSIALLAALVGSISLVRRRTERFRDGELVLREGQPCILMPPANYYSLDPKVVKISEAKEPFLVLTVMAPNSRNPGRNYTFDLRFDDTSEKDLAIKRLANWGLKAG